MLFLVATNVVASRPPERRPTGTPYARAKITKRQFKDIDEKTSTPNARLSKTDFHSINLSLSVLAVILSQVGCRVPCYR